MYHGKHRRPSAVKPLATLATVAVAPLAIAAPAHAHVDVNDTWAEAVACESGGAWNATNPSSGAHGPLQLLPSTYAAYGPGSVYNASRSEYMAAADATYRDQGWQAWVCLDADPGVPPSVGWGGWSGGVSADANASADADDNSTGHECRDPADLAWESCDVLPSGRTQAEVYASADADAEVNAADDGPVLYYNAGVAIKDLDSDGDGDPVRCGPPELLMYERCD